MNNVTIAGRLGADAELKILPSGDHVLNLRVATTVFWNKEKHTQWYSCSMWGDRALSLEKYLIKGSHVAISGSLFLSEWRNKDGDLKSQLKIRVNDLTLQGKTTGDRDKDDKQYADDNVSF